MAVLELTGHANDDSVVLLLVKTTHNSVFCVIDSLKGDVYSYIHFN